MWPRVILYTALLTAAVMPLAALLIAVPFFVLDLGKVGVGRAMLAAQVPAAVLAPNFLGPLVWLTLHHRRLAARLRDAAFTDALTGAPKRRAFFAHAAGRLGTAGGAPWLFSVLMVDVDRFKAASDRWGHEGDDAALVYVAGELGRALARAGLEGAYLARLGGEEFAVFLDGAALLEATRAAEAVCPTCAPTPGRTGAGATPSP